MGGSRGGPHGKLHRSFQMIRLFFVFVKPFGSLFQDGVLDWTVPVYQPRCSSTRTRLGGGGRGRGTGRTTTTPPSSQP